MLTSNVKVCIKAHFVNKKAKLTYGYKHTIKIMP